MGRGQASCNQPHAPRPERAGHQWGANHHPIPHHDSGLGGLSEGQCGHRIHPKPCRGAEGAASKPQSGRLIIMCLSLMPFLHVLSFLSMATLHAMMLDLFLLDCQHQGLSKEWCVRHASVGNSRVGRSSLVCLVWHYEPLQQLETKLLHHCMCLQSLNIVERAARRAHKRARGQKVPA